MPFYWIIGGVQIQLGCAHVHAAL